MPLSQGLSKSYSMEETNSPNSNIEILTLSRRDLLILDEITCRLRTQLLSANIVNRSREDQEKINFLLLFTSQLRELVLGISIEKQIGLLDCTGKVLDILGYEQIDKTLTRDTTTARIISGTAKQREYDIFIKKLKESEPNQYKYSEELGKFIDTYSKLIRKSGDFY